MNDAQLQQLAAEIRDELVTTVSQTGGHLAPNLGVVELTLGIHRALDCPADRIIFDVGHQSYVHKLITGRRERFSTLRQYGGVCGFPKRSESPYDSFDTGHASDSLSVALGIALARDARGGDETVLAVIGDGSLTGGMAFEALNHIGHLGTRLVIVLNDNEMSISQNVGALASYLARVRLDPRYNKLRDGVETKLASTMIGRMFVGAGEAVKGSVKQLLVPGMLFEELGLKYVGPIDGHDVRTGPGGRRTRQDQRWTRHHPRGDPQGPGLRPRRGPAGRLPRNRAVHDIDRKDERFRRPDQLHGGVLPRARRRGRQGRAHRRHHGRDAFGHRAGRVRRDVP